jgi:S-formylglutathione hydrolase FrmB
MTELTLLSSIKVFDGKLSRYTHNSTVCACTMTFAIFLPDGPNADIPVRNVRRFGPADP